MFILLLNDCFDEFVGVLSQSNGNIFHIWRSVSLLSNCSGRSPREI